MSISPLLSTKNQLGYRLFRGETLNAMAAAINAAGLSANPVSNGLTTVGAGTLTAALLLGGEINRSGPVADFTDTTDTGALLDAALGSNAINGNAWIVRYKNTTAFKATIAGGTGVTVSGRTVVPANSVGEYLITRTDANTYTVFGIGVTLQAFGNGTSSLVATADDGTTQTLTTAMITGGYSTTYHISVGGSTPSLTLPLGTDIDTALADMRPGQSYTLRIINKNSGNTTIVTNTGWTLSGGTLVLATNTWKEFVVTKTGTGTYTGVNVGTGTFV
jgi:hypothetical protein